MKKLIILLMALLPLGVFAQEMKIAYVNSQDIINVMPEIADIEKQLADLREKYQVEMQQMEDEYKKKYEDFVAQQETLTENIKLRRMQEIEDLQGRLENFAPIAQQDMQRKYQELFQPVQDKITSAIKTVGDENGYTYVLEAQFFQYIGNNAIDATPQVRSKLGL